MEAIYGDTSDPAVSTETNQTGRFDSILKIDPERGRYVRIHNHNGVGSRSGVPLYLDLRDTNDDALPADTEVVVAYRPAGADQWQYVTEKLGSIAIYNDLSYHEQQNSDYVDNVLVNLKNRRLTVPDVDEGVVMVKSTEQVDHSNSRIGIDEDAVERGDTR